MRIALPWTLLALPALAAQSPIRLAAPGLSQVGLDAAFAEFANEHLALELREVGVEVATAKDLSAVLGLERHKQLLGCAAQSCAVELADALGVDGLVLGDLAQVGAKLQANVKVVSARDARVLATSSARVASREALLDALAAAAKKLGPEVAQALGRPLRPGAKPSPPSAQETPDAGSCGGEWCQADVAKRQEGETLYGLNGVWANGTGDVWAVGYAGTVLRFDGQRWVERHTPAERNGVLNAVWGTGPGMVLAVGASGLAYRWKGSGWAPAHGPQRAYLRSVHGLPDGGAVWAASDVGVHRLDGRSWTQVSDAGVRDVASVALDDAWAVGDKGRIQRWNGKAWVDLRPDVPELAKRRLHAVWANGPDDVWIVGGEGAVLRYRGKGGFSFEQICEAELYAVWGTGPDNVWAAGGGGALFHWDGSDWLSQPTSASGAITSLTGAGPDHLWYVQHHGGGSSVIHLRR